MASNGGKKTNKLDRNELSKLAFSVLQENEKNKTKATTKKETKEPLKRTANSKITEPQTTLRRYVKNSSKAKDSEEKKEYPKRSEKNKKVRAKIQSKPKEKYDESIYNTKTIKKISIPKKENEELIQYDDDVLLNFYIGDNHKKIKNRIFNFAAFFFNAFYYIYRKFYITGSIVLIISILLMHFMKDIKYFLIIECIIALIMGLVFNKLYVIIGKYKIEKIKERNINENINEKCVLAGGTDSLITTLITIFYFLIILLFYFQTIYGWVMGVIDFSNKISKENEVTSFKNMVESYAINARQNIEYPGMYKYELNGEEYDFIALPVAEDDGNIYCVKLSKDSSWENKEGFEVKENSIACDEFMNDIVVNYSKYYEVELPISGELVISNQGKIIEGSHIEFEKKSCNYDVQIKDFKCD